MFRNPPPSELKGEPKKARKTSCFSFKGRSLVSQMADWDFGTLGVFVQPVRGDFVTRGGGLLSNPAGVSLSRRPRALLFITPYQACNRCSVTVTPSVQGLVFNFSFKIKFSCCCFKVKSSLYFLSSPCRAIQAPLVPRQALQGLGLSLHPH